MKRSAGILLYRLRDGRLEVFIAHMGGPFWARRDERAWSIIKGEFEKEEDPFEAARREFEEETGSAAPSGPAVDLGEVWQRNGKCVVAWAIEGDFDPATVRSNTFTLEWPRGSGEQREFPEIDRAEWFDTETARSKLVKGQVPFIDALERHILGN